MTEEVHQDRKKFVIIDGKSVFYRGYYAMPNLSTKDGTPTGGVFGFATMALEIVKRLKPDYVAVAWDKPKTNIRKRLELYPEYKAGRKPAPEDFKKQIPVLHDLLDAFGWPLYELDDYEADDIMGTLAVQAKDKNVETLLVTSDMDMLQLVNHHTHVFALKKGLSNIELYSPASFEAKHGIKVEQFLDLKAIKGDSSDNIPGVPGIGEKGATELIQQYGSLDNVYDNLSLIKESMRKKLEDGKNLAYLSKKLAEIWLDAPLKLDLEEVDGHKMQPEKILDLLQKLEFRTLAKQLPDVMQVAIDKHNHNTGKVSYVVAKDIYINTPDKLNQLLLDGKQVVYAHSYTAGKHGKDPICLVLSNSDGPTYTIDFANEQMPEAVAKKLQQIISARTKIVGYDAKSTLKVFIELGLDLPQIEHDIQIAAFLIDPLTRVQSIGELASHNLGYEGAGFENLDPVQMIGSEPEIIAMFKTLHKQQTEELATIPQLTKLAEEIEWPLIPVLAQMEYDGIRLDTDYLAKFADEIEDMISDYEQQIYGYADQEFNIASPSQLAEILFDKLKLPTNGIKKGKTGYSTAATELDKLRGIHPIIDLITQYREVAKLKNTYVDTLPKQVDNNSRIHTTYNITVAQTGRLSSNDPNLQNIPTRTDLGRRIRTAFVADKGMKFVSADYSQFELRLAAVLADDKELIEMYNRGADIHATTAAQIYEREVEDVSKQMRRAAKVINFGIIYGMSPHGLSVATGMTREQATTFIERYKAVRKPMFDYMEGVKEQAKKDGYVATLFGRRRPTPDIHSSNFVVRQAAERAAVNMPIQGTAADIMKIAMIKVSQELKEQHNDCNILLQIHDSIVVECPSEVADRVGQLIKDTMENAHKLAVRLDVDVAIGENWGEL